MLISFWNKMSAFVHFSLDSQTKQTKTEQNPKRNYFHLFFFVAESLCVCLDKGKAWDYNIFGLKKLKITWLQQRQITTDETFTGNSGQWNTNFMYFWMRRRKQVSVHGGERWMSSIEFLAQSSFQYTLYTDCYSNSAYAACDVLSSTQRVHCSYTYLCVYSRYVVWLWQ